LTDYILLDCRMSVPRQPHPSTLLTFGINPCADDFADIPNLFHVVFGNGYKEVSLYDNKVNKMVETIALLENHL
jgi:hypothetical protein